MKVKEIRVGIKLWGGFACYEGFFFNDTATTEIYTLSLHDALPILHSKYTKSRLNSSASLSDRYKYSFYMYDLSRVRSRSEEHTSELQSRQ